MFVLPATLTVQNVLLLLLCFVFHLERNFMTLRIYESLSTFALIVDLDMNTDHKNRKVKNKLGFLLELLAFPSGHKAEKVEGLSVYLLGFPNVIVGF